MSETPGEAPEPLLAALPPTSQARFACARHGTEAGVVKLYRRFSEDSSLVIESFAGRAWHRIPLPEDADTLGDPVAEALQDVLAQADAVGLLLLDPSWAPFYCVDCRKSYCGACWRTWEVYDDDFPDWIDQTRGVCPEGHERMLSD
jgi:hypothetical protein